MSSLAFKDRKIEMQGSGIAKVLAATETRAVAVRVAMHVGQSVVLGHWIGIAWAIAWLAAVSANDLILPFLTRRFVAPYAASDPARARLNTQLIVLYGGIVFVSGWAAAWIIGHESFGFFAALFLSLVFIHAWAYYRLRRDVLIVCIAVPGALCFTIPFATGQAEGLGLAYVVGLSTVLAMFYLAQLHTAKEARSLDQLEAKWRMAEDGSRAKSHFMTAMTHELRTPLNVIIGYAEMLKEEARADGRDGDGADAATIKKAALGLLTIIEDVLDFAELSGEQLQLNAAGADIGALVREVCDAAAPLAAANGNTLSVAMSPAQLTAVVDRKRVRQCLLHLVTNACKFTVSGSIQIEVTRAGDLISFAVVDTGCGVSDAEMALLFQPFVQVDAGHTRKNGGVGLGLVVTQRLARLMGGDVQVASKPGVGSTFTFTIRAMANEQSGHTPGDAARALDHVSQPAQAA